MISGEYRCAQVKRKGLVDESVEDGKPAKKQNLRWRLWG